MGGSPTSAEKRSANADRDMLAWRASDASVHSSPGLACIPPSARPTCGSRSPASHPVGGASRLASQRRSTWMTRMSASLVITASPPGRIASASRAMSRSTAWNAPPSPSSHASTRITSGSCAVSRAVSGPSTCIAAYAMRVGSPPPPPKRMCS